MKKVRGARNLGFHSESDFVIKLDGKSLHERQGCVYGGGVGVGRESVFQTQRYSVR